MTDDVQKNATNKKTIADVSRMDTTRNSQISLHAT